MRLLGRDSVLSGGVDFSRSLPRESVRYECFFFLRRRKCEDHIEQRCVLRERLFSVLQNVSGKLQAVYVGAIGIHDIDSFVVRLLCFIDDATVHLHRSLARDSGVREMRKRLDIARDDREQASRDPAHGGGVVRLITLRRYLEHNRFKPLCMITLMDRQSGCSYSEFRYLIL